MGLDVVLYKIVKNTGCLHNFCPKFRCDINDNIIDKNLMSEVKMSYDDYENFLHYNFYEDGDFVYVMDNDMMITITGIYIKNIGEVRQPANKAFYKDGMRNSDWVFDYETLMEHYEKYFKEWDKETDGIFTREILNKFKEGKTFLSYQ